MKKLYIIKIGGNIIDDSIALEQFLVNFSLIDERKLLIHGGGKTASELAKKLGVSQAMVNGRRITDGETLKITTMVYAGLINKQIVASLQAKKISPPTRKTKFFDNCRSIIADFTLSAPI